MRNRLKQIDYINIAYHLLTNEKYRSYCADYGRNGRIFRFEHPGEENPGENIYFIEWGYRATGMFALIMQTLRRLEVADRFHFTPVVLWSDQVPYHVPGQPNTFLTFFQPVSGITVESAKHSQDVVFSNGWDCAYGPIAAPYEFSRNEIDRLAVIYKKYLKLRPEIQFRIEGEVGALFDKIPGKLLGVHVRGVDWRKMKVVRHPIAATEEDYLRAARKMTEEMGYERIFLASDSDGTIDLFRREFGDRLITTQAVRAPADSGELAIFNEKNDGYQMGYEILRDVYALANCDALLCGLSNVSYGAQIINIATATAYERVELLDKGKVESGLTPNEAWRKQRNELCRKNS